MDVIEAWIEGTAPLLMHRFVAEQELEQTIKAVNTTKLLPREIAEKQSYRDKEGLLYMPGACMSRIIANAGSGHKQKSSRKSVKYVVHAAVRVIDEEMPLFALDRTTRLSFFEVDSRSVVNAANKARVMSHRARIEKWSLRFHLTINEALLDAATVRTLVTEGGVQYGLGAFRVALGGPFGTYDLVSWEVSKLSTATRRQRETESAIGQSKVAV